MTEGRTLGQHLASRLVELGVEDFFAVPGDYNLVLLDQLLKEPKLKMINTCNELSKPTECDMCTDHGALACELSFFTVQMLAMLPTAMQEHAESAACV